MADKIYVGKGKEITGQYGSFINLGLKLEELEKYANEQWYVNITVSKMKNADQWNNTHSATINDYKPQPKKEDNLNDIF